MLLARFTHPDAATELEGEILDGRAVSFADGTHILDRLASGDRTPAGGDSWPLEEVTLLAPIARPRIIFCVGLNYQDHLTETGSEGPSAPMIFLKPDSSSTDPGGTVHPPAVIRQLDYEGELAVVMGADGEVAGYAIADDLSAREIQRAERQWSRAKGFDDSCPWGPWITTADSGVSPAGLRLRTLVNGEVRQDASTAEMIFDIPTVVSFLRETCTLRPGDLILTGTPSGVGIARGESSLLSEGDVVRIEIEQLGAIEHTIGAPR